MVAQIKAIVDLIEGLSALSDDCKATWHLGMGVAGHSRGGKIAALLWGYSQPLADLHIGAAGNHDIGLTDDDLRNIKALGKYGHGLSSAKTAVGRLINAVQYCLVPCSIIELLHQV